MRITRSTLEIIRSVYTRKKPTITLAPEAGTKRMIRIIGKKIDLDDLNPLIHTVRGVGYILENRT